MPSTTLAGFNFHTEITADLWTICVTFTSCPPLSSVRPLRIGANSLADILTGDWEAAAVPPLPHPTLALPQHPQQSDPALAQLHSWTWCLFQPPEWPNALA